MKRVVFAALIVLLSMPGLRAHGVVHSVSRDEAVIVNAMYQGDEPMAYAEVKVFSPSDREVEYQNARTDKNGKFAFYPDQKGEWTVQVNDGMGHGFTEKVDVSTIGEMGHTHGGLSATHKAVMAICVVWGFAGFYFYFKRKQTA